MSISVALSNALSGMNAAQAGIATVSQNVANANTVGYSRQIISLQQRVIGGVSNGVDIASIGRAVDSFLVRELRIQISTLGAAVAVDTFFSQIQARFGTAGNNSTNSADLADFAAALEALATNPEDQALRFDMVAAGTRLAQGISVLANSVQKLRADADREIKTAVDSVNAQLIVVGDLNDSIARAQLRGENSSAMEDLRDLAVANIAANIDISTYSIDNGKIAILTADGRTLLDQNARQIDFSPASAVQASTVFSAITIYSVDAITGAYVGAGDIIATGGTSSTVVSIIKGGRIKGLLDIRDNTLNNLASQVEALATTIRDQYNAIHNTGVSFPAPNALTGTRAVAVGDAFAATGTVRISVVDGAGLVVGVPLDLDLTALGAVTVGDLATAIDAALGADGSAAVVDGKLKIWAANGAFGIAINEGDSQVTGTTQGFSNYFGLNDFFTGAEAKNLAVRGDITKDPSLVAVGLLSTTATTGESGTTIGDNRVAIQLAALVEKDLTFAAVGGLPAGTFTLGNYAAAILGLNAVQAAAAADSALINQSLVANLDYRATSFSGVNIDEELANMIVFENAFAASARVLKTAAEMFKLLIELAA